MLILISISMALLSAAPPALRPWQMWLVAIVAADILAAVIGMLVLASWQRKHGEKRLALELINQGNVPCSYELSAEDPEGRLGFTFRAQGTDLSLQLYGEPQPSTGAPTIPVSAPPSRASRAGPNDGSAPNVIDSAMAGSRAVGDVLRTASMFAPAAARGPLAKVVSSTWRVQATTQRARTLQGQVSMLAGSTERTGSPAPAPAAGAHPGAATALFTQTWARTSLLQPGEALIVDMLVRVAKSVPGGRYAFTVLSRPADQPEAPVQTERGSILVEQRSWIRRHLPYLLVAAAGIVVLILAFWLASVGALGQ